jgi:hypothetical protein
LFGVPYCGGGGKMPQHHLVAQMQMLQLHNMWLVANAASDTHIQKCFILNFENLNLLLLLVNFYIYNFICKFKPYSD